MKEERKQKIALFRFGVISGILSVKDTEKGEREKRIGEAAAKEWQLPYSGRSYIGRSTIRDWLKRYEESGGNVESLFPHGRSDHGEARCMDKETESTLMMLRKEMPAASLPVLMRVAKDRKVLPPDFSASPQSIYRLFKRHGVDEPAAEGKDLRRFEAELSNDLWQSDCLHGPMVLVDGKLRKSFGFVFIDDHSRLIPHAEFYLRENIEDFMKAFKSALKKRGLPRKLYVDNGPYFRSHQLDYSCASLGVSLIHCTAYRPEGKGKIERFNKTIRVGFLSTLLEPISLEDLNGRFWRWINAEYHVAVHGSTAEKPIERYLKHLHLIRPAPKDLDDYFRIKAERSVDKDRTVSLLGKVYEAPVALVGKKVTLLYSQDHPQKIEALYDGKSYGFLVPLNAHINCAVRRKHKITEFAPNDPGDGTPTSYGGGKLFDKETPNDEL